MTPRAGCSRRSRRAALLVTARSARRRRWSPRSRWMPCPLKGFDEPVLLAWGDSDKLFPLDQPAASKPTSNARLEIIPDANTYVMLDQPEALARSSGPSSPGDRESAGQRPCSHPMSSAPRPSTNFRSSRGATRFDDLDALQALASGIRGLRSADRGDPADDRRLRRADRRPPMVHVDVERATPSPFGGPIAHGYSSPLLEAGGRGVAQVTGHQCRQLRRRIAALPLPRPSRGERPRPQPSRCGRRPSPAARS